MSEPESFKNAYATLLGHAKTMREQQEPDIDNLLCIVKESMEAYQVCKKRIEAVEAALQETFGSEPGGSGMAGPR